MEHAGSPGDPCVRTRDPERRDRVVTLMQDISRSPRECAEPGQWCGGEGWVGGCGVGRVVPTNPIGAARLWYKQSQFSPDAWKWAWAGRPGRKFQAGGHSAKQSQSGRSTRWEPRNDCVKRTQFAAIRAEGAWAGKLPSGGIAGSKYAERSQFGWAQRYVSALQKSGYGRSGRQIAATKQSQLKSLECEV